MFIHPLCFDTDYYYWSTILETHNKNDAQVLYDALRVAKEHGFLNEAAANSYWRYIAVDVRLKTEYHYPQIQPAPLNPLYSKSFQLKR